MRQKLKALDVLLLLAVLLVGCGQKGEITIDNTEDGQVTVTAQKAGEGSGGVGYITLAEGQTLAVESNLEGNSSIQIKVRAEGDDQTALVDETITGVNTYSYDLEPGDYNVLITSGKNTTGTLLIYPEGEASAESAQATDTADAADASASGIPPLPNIPELAGLSNPVVKVTEQEQLDTVGMVLNAPEKATNVERTVIFIEDNENLIAAVSFEYDGHKYEYRAQMTGELETYDMSGLHYKWTSEEAGEVNGREAKIYTCDEVGYISWMDVVPGVNYNLSCLDPVDGETLEQVANLVFEELQGDSDAS